ncbi:hypothetical protein VULLAG_LOCUS18013 [Vulpes lagopus]
MYTARSQDFGATSVSVKNRRRRERGPVLRRAEEPKVEAAKVGLDEVCSNGYMLRGEGAAEDGGASSASLAGGACAVAGAPRCPKAAAQHDLRHRGHGLGKLYQDRPGARGLDAKLSPSQGRALHGPSCPPSARGRGAAHSGLEGAVRSGSGLVRRGPGPRLPFPPRLSGPFPAPGTAPGTGISGATPEAAQALGQQVGPSGRSQARTSKTKT